MSYIHPNKSTGLSEPSEGKSGLRRFTPAPHGGSVGHYLTASRPAAECPRNVKAVGGSQVQKPRPFGPKALGAWHLLLAYFPGRSSLEDAQPPFNAQAKPHCPGMLCPALHTAKSPSCPSSLMFNLVFSSFSSLTQNSVPFFLFLRPFAHPSAHLSSFLSLPILI